MYGTITVLNSRDAEHCAAAARAIEALLDELGDASDSSKRTCWPRLPKSLHW